jgi:TatD DNase family protein
MLIDTHSHLYAKEFDNDQNEAVTRALSVGVKKILLPNIDIESIDRLHQLCNNYPEICYPMMGLHPGSVNENWENDLAIIYSHLSQNKYIAVGEIGMDLYWDKTFQKEQEMAFKRQVEWAKEFNLPIVIHAREAFQELFAILDEVNDDRLTGVFHCFTGTLKEAMRIQAYGGFKIGIGGVFTYKKSELTEVVKNIPLKMLILETDAPYLPPVPHRGKRNESAYLIHIAEKLADIKNLSVEEIGIITSKNAFELFNLARYEQK